jgi:hypothetical protein
VGRKPKIVVTSFVLNGFKSFVEWMARAPTLRLWFEAPTYSFLPASRLKVHEVEVPPCCSRIGIENFGSSTCAKLRVKLIDAPDYPIESHNVPASSWRYLDATNEIVIDELDPQVTATFLLFFD